MHFSFSIAFKPKIFFFFYVGIQKIISKQKKSSFFDIDNGCFRPTVKTTRVGKVQNAFSLFNIANNNQTASDHQKYKINANKAVQWFGRSMNVRAFKSLAHSLHNIVNTSHLNEYKQWSKQIIF